MYIYVYTQTTNKLTNIEHPKDYMLLDNIVLLGFQGFLAYFFLPTALVMLPPPVISLNAAAPLLVNSAPSQSHATSASSPPPTRTRRHRVSINWAHVFQLNSFCGITQGTNKFLQNLTIFSLPCCHLQCCRGFSFAKGEGEEKLCLKKSIPQRGAAFALDEEWML